MRKERLIFAGARSCISSLTQNLRIMTTHQIQPRDRVIVALDVASADEAITLMRELSGEVSFFKIGLQLYTAAGPEIVRAVSATGAKVFLDLKLHDIPNTVAK